MFNFTFKMHEKAFGRTHWKLTALPGLLAGFKERDPKVGEGKGWDDIVVRTREGKQREKVGENGRATWKGGGKGRHGPQHLLTKY